MTQITLEYGGNHRETGFLKHQIEQRPEPVSESNFLTTEQPRHGSIITCVILTISLWEKPHRDETFNKLRFVHRVELDSQLTLLQSVIRTIQKSTRPEN